MTPRLIRFALLLVALASFPLAAGAATITIVNVDGAGEGFNQTTPTVAPVGGNPGTTPGAQRLNVFNRAAAIWGALLPSNVTIRVRARFDPFTPCDATSAVLGGAGPISGFADFPNTELPGTSYAVALASKLSGFDLAPAVGDGSTSDDITARFNTNVDNTTCLGTSNWYYGYDHNEGTNVDLLAVVLHELGHGLGFLTFANSTTGMFSGGLPDVFSHYLLDTSSGLHWDQMNEGQRVASAINSGRLVWSGPYGVSRARTFLAPGGGLVRVDSPGGIAGEKSFGTAAFGPAIPNPPLSGEVVLIEDSFAPTSDACELPIVNAAAVAGKIALIDRGICTFVSKAIAAQDAGAIAVVVANNTTGIINMGGEDLGVAIPCISITQADGVAIKAQLGTGVTMTIGQDSGRLWGADAAWKPRMYAPNPVEPGSSVAHFDVSASPNLLMEPAINDDLTDSVDLAQYLFEDMGWFPRLAGVENPAAYTMSLRPNAPNPFRTQTAIRFELERPGVLEIEVFDLSGRAVKQVTRSWQPAGPGSVQWDGTDDGGRRVAPGVYLYRMRNGSHSETRRMVLAD